MANPRLGLNGLTTDSGASVQAGVEISRRKFSTLPISYSRMQKNFCPCFGQWWEILSLEFNFLKTILTLLSCGQLRFFGFNPSVPRVQKIKICQSALADFCWVNLWRIEWILSFRDWWAELGTFAIF